MKELLHKSRKELEKMLGEEREALRLLRFCVKQGEETNVRAVRNVRKRVARILTLFQMKK